MRRTQFGALVGTVLILGIAVGRGSSEPTAVGQVPTAYSIPSSGGLASHMPPAEGGPQAVVIVDSNQRVMAVYHVDRSSGEIGLRSVRNLTWDLEMLEYNSGEPLPQDIRKMRSETQR